MLTARGAGRKIGGSNLDPPEEDNLPSRGSRIDRHPPAVPMVAASWTRRNPHLRGMTSLPDNLPDISSASSYLLPTCAWFQALRGPPEGPSIISARGRSPSPIAPCIRLRGAMLLLWRLETPHRAVTAPVRLAVFLCPPVPAGCVANTRPPRGEYVTPSLCGSKAPGAHHGMRVNPWHHEEKTVTTRTIARPAESVRDSFDVLHTRLMSSLSRLQVVCEAWQLRDVPKNRARRLRFKRHDQGRGTASEDAERWYIHHEHTPNAKRCNHEQRHGQHRSHASKLGRTVTKSGRIEGRDLQKALAG